MNGEFVWADKISDPVHMKSNYANETFTNPDGSVFTIPVKTEFKQWANKALALWSQMDDTDIERYIATVDAMASEL